MAGGRPTLYNDTIANKAREYIKNYQEYGHAMPSIVGMAVALNVGKSTLYDWANTEGNKFSDILAECMDNQELVLFNNALTNQFNATIAKLALGKHGYSEKTETNHSGTLGLEAYELTETERSARIAALLNQGRARRDGEADNARGTEVDTARGAAE